MLPSGLNNANKIDVTKPYAFAKAGVSKIDYYGLGDITLDLRRKGMSYLNIAKTLSTDYQDRTNGDSISVVSVTRWLKNHEEEPIDYEKGYVTINVYKERLRMLRAVDNNIEMLKIFLDAVQNMITNSNDNETILKMFKQTKDLQINMEHYIARRQTLVSDIYQCQKEIINMVTLNEIIRTTLETVKKADKGVYAKVMVQLRNNPKYVEAIKKIDE